MGLDICSLFSVFLSLAQASLKYFVPRLISEKKVVTCGITSHATGLFIAAVASQVRIKKW